MKKILFGLAALSAMAFGADEVMPSPSTGVHTTRGSNQIDVKTRAYIINSGLVITASAGSENATISDAIKKAILDHGTLMAGTSKISEVSKTVYVRRTDSKNFPKGTAINIELKHAQTGTELNRLKTGTNVAGDKNSFPHTLTAEVSNATFDDGANGSLTNNTLTIANTTDSHAGNFVIEDTTTNNIEVTLKSRIEAEATSPSHEEGEYTNTSTLAVKFSKVPEGTVNTNHELANTNTGVPTSTLARR